jgi:uncharacterized protein (UPF0332 family)
MSRPAGREVAEYWMRRADAALESAASEIAAGRLDFAVNRAYYACFYAASAVLLIAGRTFVKHSGLRGAVHRDLVKTGRLAPQWGKAYDRLFDARQTADYLMLAEVEAGEAEELLALASGFVGQMQRLYADDSGG